MPSGDEYTTENKPESEYPVKSIHSFLVDVQKELERLRVASVIGVVACFLILLSLIRFALRLMEFGGMFPHAQMGMRIDTVLLALATLSLIYSVYALYGQSRFFKKWGRKFELLEGVERRLMKDEQ